MKRLFFLASIIFFPIAIWTENSMAEDTIKIGYMICNDLKETSGRFDPLTNFLSQKLGRKFEAVYLNTYEIEDVFRDKKIDFVHANSVIYIILKENYNAKLILGEKSGTGGKDSAGIIIVRNDSDIKTVSGLKNKRFVFGPSFSTDGFYCVYDLLKQNGLDPEIDLGYYAIPFGSFKHDKVLYAVYYKAFDAGAARLDDVKDAVKEKKFEPGDFRIIAKSEMVPYCTLAARKEIDDGLIKQVKNVLLGLKPDDTGIDANGERLLVLKRGWIDGFVEVNDKDYDILRKMAKRAELPPYEKY
ncbi:MAG: phosphate/phosphite/phosphonate ABC transporter substrate-binding protein [bacterium]